MLARGAVWVGRTQIPPAENKVSPPNRLGASFRTPPVRGSPDRGSTRNWPQARVISAEPRANGGTGVESDAGGETLRKRERSFSMPNSAVKPWVIERLP